MSLDSPLFSLVLPVLNGLPHMTRAVEGIRCQTYRNFELIVQDGGSTDGSLDFLRSVEDLPRIDIVSKPDRGIGQAYGRGFKRCRGDLVVLVACDEVLNDDALETFVEWHRIYPDAATVYGSMRMVDENYDEINIFTPPPFDIFQFIKCEIFPTFAGFLNVAKVGDQFYYDETLKTCPDYDFFIRLAVKCGNAALVAREKVVNAVRWDRTSMSFRTEFYDQFLEDKLFVLNRFLDTQEDSAELRILRRDAGCGICLWLAESTLGSEDYTELFKKYLAMARNIDPQAYEVAMFIVDSDIVDRPAEQVTNALIASAERTSVNLPRFLNLLLRLDEMERYAIGAVFDS